MAPDLPPGYRWSLPQLYSVWAVAIAILYAACRRYAEYKAAHRDVAWLRFL